MCIRDRFEHEIDLRKQRLAVAHLQIVDPQRGLPDRRRILKKKRRHGELRRLLHNLHFFQLFSPAFGHCGGGGAGEVLLDIFLQFSDLLLLGVVVFDILFPAAFLLPLKAFKIPVVARYDAELNIADTVDNPVQKSEIMANNNK